MKEAILNYLKERQTLLTVFAIAIILIGGVQIVDNPDNWWVTPAFILGGLALVLIFLHAVIIIKAGLAFFVAIISFYISMLQGDIIDYELGFGGLIASTAVLCLFFLCLGLSYLIPSTKSRWTTLTLTLIIHQVFEYSLVLGLLDLYWGVGLAFGFALLFFFFYYSLKSWRAYRSDKMPDNIASDILTKNVQESFTTAGWEFRDLRRKGNQGGYLVWKDKAFFLWPVQLLQDFQEWNKMDLRYNDKSINPWLASIAEREIPAFRTRNADIMPVLLDINNANGSSGKVIGVSTPETKRKTPFGIFPTRELNSSRRKKTHIITNFTNRFDDEAFSLPLNDKQKKALSKLNKKSEELSVKGIDGNDDSTDNDADDNTVNNTDDNASTEATTQSQKKGRYQTPLREEVDVTDEDVDLTPETEVYQPQTISEVLHGKPDKK